MPLGVSLSLSITGVSAVVVAHEVVHLLGGGRDLPPTLHVLEVSHSHLRGVTNICPQLVAGGGDGGELRHLLIDATSPPRGGGVRVELDLFISKSRLVISEADEA